MTFRTLTILALASAAVALPSRAEAQRSLVCPAVSTNTSFSGAALGDDCPPGVPTTSCTTKDGVVFDGGAGLLRLPGSAGNFQPPPGAVVQQNVYYAAPADFDRDGWEDFLAANNADQIVIMRNQTITCGTAGCTPTAAQTIPTTWWGSITNIRQAAFRAPPSPVKPAVTGTNRESPMVAGDFNGDGWPDAIVISATHDAGSNQRWPTAARLFLNTQNCRNAAGQPCGAGMLCGSQPAHGECTGTGLTRGVPHLETELSCLTTSSCTINFPTFATYDVRTGAAVSGTGTTTSNAPTTHRPGDFGPINHSAQNMQVLDWDGDGDLDLLFGHSAGTCPGSLCTTLGRVFYAGIDVWLNDCNTRPSWNAATRSCAGDIPRFSRNLGACTATTCNNPDVLIPSTAHNSTTIRPDANLNIEHGTRTNVGFAYVDIDQDGDRDLVVGSPGCCANNSNARHRLRVFRGTSNSLTVHTLDTANPISLSTSGAGHPGFEGALTGVFVHDFSGDGWPDIITGSDGVAYPGAGGGRTRYWRHTGDTAAPFGTNWPACSSNPAICAGCSATCSPNPTLRMSESTGNPDTTNAAATPPQFGDFDIGFMIDYDNDPARTRDIAFTNGNNTGEFFLFPNRSSPSTVAPCGAVASGTLPTPPRELTVDGACLTPNATVPAGTSISYYLNNEDPANFQLACRQTSTGFSPPLVGGQCCVSFPTSTGRSITWRAVFDSNTTDGTDVCTATGTDTPRLTSVTANYTYTQANEHYESGVVISDGITYVGSFTQPGNRGHLYAVAAGDGTRYFDAADKLDAQTTRNIYTTDLTGANLTRIDVTPVSPSAALQARLGASDATEAAAIVNWVRSPRFGLGTPGFPPTKLGAIQNSTPAVLTPPYRPAWYTYLTPPEKARYDEFAVDHADRVPLVLVAAMDGMLHAFISLPTDIGNAVVGTEAWGFIPPFVASAMGSDRAATVATGALTVTSYPDGSPALLDFKKSNGDIATAVLFSDGDGGNSITALDVTSTIDRVSFNVSGPRPLWSHQPGGSAAGRARSKPGVARSRITGQERYVVVAGTGELASDPSKGKIVAGYDLETGELLWRFELECALTSDVTIFDTDDDGTHEPGNPRLDGWADRAVFADACGYLYKLDPGQDRNGAWIGNSGHGGISLGTSNGVARYALFSTTQSGALGAGAQRPIVGTIGARSDATTDVVLFFGTGGSESLSPTLVNEFYAVYAKDGTIRNKLTGACAGTRCEKFYGGVVVTPDSVIIQRSTDPVIGSGTCDFGTSSVQAYGLNPPYTQVFDVTAIDGLPIHAAAGPLFGDAGALYFATVSGEIKRIGAPRVGVAGGDTAAGHRPGNGAAEGSAPIGPLTLIGYRVVL